MRHKRYRLRFLTLLTILTLSVLQCEKPETGKNISEFAVNDGSTDYVGIIEEKSVTFDKKVPYGTTEVSIKIIALTPKASANKSVKDILAVGTSTITVTAEDESTKEYSVTIQVGDPPTLPPVTRKPSVSNGEVVNIRVNSAAISGTLVDVGSRNVTAYGHVWSTANNPTITGSGVSKNDLGAATTSGTTFSTPITGLSENTTYFVRTYATNSVGTAYSDVKTFTTLQISRFSAVSGAAQVRIATSESGTTLVINATSALSTIDSGNITQHGHVYSNSAQNDNLTIGVDNVLHTTLGSKSEAGEFTSTLEDLNAFTTYYIRPYATSNTGTVYGTQAIFTTPAGAPTVTIGEAIPTLTSITISGAIINVGGNNLTITEYGHIWSTTSGNLTTALDTKTEKGSTTQTKSFSSIAEGLTKNITYYFVVYAMNSVGTAYSQVQSFKTLNDETSIRSLSIGVSGSTFSQTKSTSDGTITGTTLVFENLPYGSTQAKVTAFSLADQATATINENTFTTESVLSIGTNTVKVTASDGTTTQNYTINLTIEPAVAPQLNTLSATNVGFTAATLNGEITDLGVSPMSGYGFIYSTTSGEALTLTGSGANVKVGNSRETGSFTRDITGLSENTTYYFVAYATNASGVTYGQAKSFFTTLTIPNITLSISENILSGTITDIDILNASVTDFGFIYSTHSNIALSDSTLQLGKSGVTKVGKTSFTNNGTSYNFTETVFNPCVTNYFRTFITSNSITKYGVISTFNSTSNNATFTLNGADAGLQTGFICPNSTHIYHIPMSNQEVYSLSVNGKTDVSENVEVYAQGVNTAVSSNQLYIRQAPFSESIGSGTYSFLAISGGTRYMVLPLSSNTHQIVVSNTSNQNESYSLNLEENTTIAPYSTGRVLTSPNKMGFYNSIYDINSFWIHIPANKRLQVELDSIRERDDGAAARVSMPGWSLLFSSGFRTPRPLGIKKSYPRYEIILMDDPSPPINILRQQTIARLIIHFVD